MSTQAHVKIVKNHRNHDKMLWINHDAFPDVIVPKIKQTILNTDEIIMFHNLVNEFELEDLGSFYTVEETLHQTMEYLYTLEIIDEHIYLRVQEEYWIEEDETNNIPRGYLSSEMRTITVEQLI